MQESDECRSVTRISSDDNLGHGTETGFQRVHQERLELLFSNLHGQILDIDGALRHLRSE